MNSKNDNIYQRAEKKLKKRRIKKYIKIGEREKKVLALIGAGVLVIGSLALPNLPMALKPLFDDRPSQFRDLLDKLKKKRLITLGGEEIKLSSKGLKLLKEIQIKDIEIKKPEKWDGVWHLVSYDVPKLQNHDRDVFRATLKRWNFYQLQASLWVFPYDCKEEIAVLADYLNISDFVIVMNTDYLPNEELVENYFDFNGD